MSFEIAIDVHQLCKSYLIFEKPSHRLLQMLFRGRRRFYQEHEVLRDISFQVRRGETVGIVGRNGAGKSTLLQILCGVVSANSGHCLVHGRIAALLELGAGFNPEFTGRENIFMSAQILGLSQDEIERRYDEIVAFADIGEYVLQPVKTYSSGMFMRLAFAVIAHVDADVLVIDEALAVGDAYFVQKCMRFLRRFREKGGTLLFVSHDSSAISALCDRAIWLSEGAIRMDDTPKRVTQHYLADMYLANQGGDRLSSGMTLAEGRSSEAMDYVDARRELVLASNLRNDLQVGRFDTHAESFGKGGAKVTAVHLTQPDGGLLSWAIGGESVRLCVRFRALQPLTNVIVGFLVKNKQGQSLFGDNTFLAYVDRPVCCEAGQEKVAIFEFRMPILPAGEYAVSVAVSEGSQDSHVVHHWYHDALVVSSHSSQVSTGLVGIPMWNICIEDASA
ncbi:ABC transporter ATP-binding protein [Rhodanobacter sp. DHB23]|uniref:ABC transporter ATP-binding protein n=1 Tax=Rhodanobacter sp. DHB23 TaxID=2775923 RepID=UPI00177B7DCA|nr:ABC transporter ATP-binding protein [Rhodanobacter sp. DHB23]MBD8873279.1 ABC transporter ATP-binding protein [Rhodanobacter sp. DHB23]